MELLEWGNNKLKEHQEADQVSGTLDSPMLDAELLLAATLEQPKPYLFSHLNHDVPEKKAEVFRKMIKRRAKNEPLSYITGRKDFFGRTFNINRFVLIPRPATETLVEEVIEIEKN